MYSLREPLSEAVRKGVFAHGLAVDLSAKGNTQRDLTTAAVLDNLPAAAETNWTALERPSRDRYSGGVIIS
jgi:hypothetical protein